MEIFAPGIEDYLHRVTPESEAVPFEVEKRAARENFPIVGPLVGRLLAFLARIIQAKTVFELGSGYGYSAYWFATAIGPEGKVICTDFSGQNRADAQDYLTRAGIWDRIDFRLGDALEIFEQERGPFDIVYIDINKDLYPQALELAKTRVRKGGLIIADNILHHGKVLHDNPNETAKGILLYNESVSHDPELETILLPLRDGVAVSRKL